MRWLIRFMTVKVHAIRTRPQDRRHGPSIPLGPMIGSAAVVPDYPEAEPTVVALEMPGPLAQVRIDRNLTTPKRGSGKCIARSGRIVSHRAIRAVQDIMGDQSRPDKRPSLFQSTWPIAGHVRSGSQETVFRRLSVAVSESARRGVDSPVIILSENPQLGPYM